jgi:hypothetical protein
MLDHTETEDEAAVHSETRIKLRRLSWLIHAANVEVKLQQFARISGAKYDPNQPRVPAGNPEGGQWADGTGGAGEATGFLGEFSNQQLRRLVDVIKVCIAEQVSLSTDDKGFKTFSVTYLCAGGRTFKIEGIGHKFHGIIRDPFGSP